MTLEEVMKKGKEFADMDVAKLYTSVALFAEWQKETGGTAEEFLAYLEKNCPKKKKNSCRA